MSRGEGAQEPRSRRSRWNCRVPRHRHLCVRRDGVPARWSLALLPRCRLHLLPSHLSFFDDAILAAELAYRLSLAASLGGRCRPCRSPRVRHPEVLPLSERELQQVRRELVPANRHPPKGHRPNAACHSMIAWSASERRLRPASPNLLPSDLILRRPTMGPVGVDAPGPTAPCSNSVEAADHRS